MDQEEENPCELCYKCYKHGPDVLFFTLGIWDLMMN